MKRAMGVLLLMVVFYFYFSSPNEWGCAEFWYICIMDF